MIDDDARPTPRATARPVLDGPHPQETADMTRLTQRADSDAANRLQYLASRTERLRQDVAKQRERFDRRAFTSFFEAVQQLTASDLERSAELEILEEIQNKLLGQIEENHRWSDLLKLTEFLRRQARQPVELGWSGFASDLFRTIRRNATLAALVLLEEVIEG